MSTQTVTMTHNDNMLARLAYFVENLAQKPALQEAARKLHRFAELAGVHQEPSGTIHMEPDVPEAALYTEGFLHIRELVDEANSIREYGLAAFMTSLLRLAVFFDYPIPFNFKRHRSTNASGNLRPQFDPDRLLEKAS